MNAHQRRKERRKNKNKVFICLEFPDKFYFSLEQYKKGEITEEDFLKEIKYKQIGVL